MNHETEKELGISIALLERFSEQRFPRILRMLDEVKEGQVLSQDEIDFLEDVLETCRQISGTVQEMPQYLEIYNRAIEVYHEVTTLALENEKKARHLS
jgi:hypothetical protein